MIYYLFFAAFVVWTLVVLEVGHWIGWRRAFSKGWANGHKRAVHDFTSW